MLFSSIKYLIFFPTVALAYFILPQNTLALATNS